MAIFHLNVRIVSRGKGGSITATAAYNSGEKLRDNYTGKIHNRSYRQDVIYKEILLPLEAPHELLDRQTLLNALNASERRKDAQMARIIKIALPNELSLNEHIALTKEFVFDNFVSIGMCADIAIHAGLLDKSRKPASIEAVHERIDNPHAHIIIPFRMIDKNGFHRTKVQSRYMNKPSYLVKWRKEWARLQNREFERRGLQVRVSHESHEVRGIELEPTKHIGPAVMALELQGIQTNRGDDYREIIKRNVERETAREKSRERKRDFARSR
jgi:ATP-dependent exoDNAse (exonuclease V) alpha subunit